MIKSVRLNSFKGLTVLITGASGGIGLSFAKALAQAGANLILVARSGDLLMRIAEDLKHQFNVSVAHFDLDLSLPDSPERLHAMIQDSRFSVDVLINNAGFGWTGLFEQSRPEMNQTMMMLNMAAAVKLSHLFLPAMLSKGRGGIINIASTAAFQPMPNMSLYAASKAFVLSFTEGLWGEYQNRGVRVLCVCPGHTETGFHRTAVIGKKEIFFLASPDSVVKMALRTFLKRSAPVLVCGWGNYILSLGYRLLPRRWLIWISGRIFKRACKPGHSE